MITAELVDPLRGCATIAAIIRKSIHNYQRRLVMDSFRLVGLIPPRVAESRSEYRVHKIYYLELT
jgi:hypothetical protein